MKYTTNYNFKKPEATDTVNIKDFNDTFDLVDGKLKETQEKNTSLDDTFKQLVINAGTSNAEIVAARRDNINNVTHASLPVRLDNVTTQLAEIPSQLANGLILKRDKSTKIISEDLDTSSDVNKIQLVNLATEVLNTIATASGLTLNAIPADLSLVLEQYADKSMSFFKTNFVDTGKNVFNNNDVTKGYYVQYNTGTIIANVSYGYSGFIPVSANTSYYMNFADQVAYYDYKKIYISGKASAGNTFTTPSNCAYMIVSFNLNYLNRLQVEKGITGTTFEEWGICINTLKPTGETLSRIINNENMIRALPYKSIIKIMDDLKNPFIKTIIKIIGDSITAGVGGTGYSATGEAIGTTGYYANLPTATCWANLLKSNIESNYNQYRYVSMLDGRIKNIGGGTTTILQSYDGGTKLGTKVRYNNNASAYTEFSFNGDKFSIVHIKSSGSGILDIYIDNVKIGSLDAYSTTFLWSQETEFTTTLGNHTVRIQETGMKNASASDRIVQLEALKIPKTVVVKNWGISGIGTTDLLANKSQLIESNDDIVIMQIGTNDRFKRSVVESTKDLQKQMIQYVEGLGKKIIQMVAPPTSTIDEALVSRNFHMWDVDRIIGELSAGDNKEYISNYQYLKKYCVEQNISIDILLSDGLHPNDRGYVLIYNYICSRLGISQT